MDGVDALAELTEIRNQLREDHGLPLLHREREHLHGEHRIEAVDRETGKAVRLAEDEAAGVKVLPHHGTAVVHGIAHAARPEAIIGRVVFIARDDAHADLRGAVIKAETEPAAVLHRDIRERAVGTGLRAG